MSRPHFLKALSAMPASQADFKQALERTLSSQEQLTAELARKDTEIRELKTALEQIQSRLARMADPE